MGKASRARVQRRQQRQTIRTQASVELDALQRALNGDVVQADTRLLQIFNQLVARYGVLPEPPPSVSAD